MADLSISPEEVRAALDSFVESYQPAQVVTDEVGHVTETADGIARVEAFPAPWRTSFCVSKTERWAWR